MNVSKLMSSLIGFVAGALVGSFATAWWMQAGIQQANEIVAMQTVAAEADEALKQYRTAKQEVAVYALERYAELLESYRADNLRILDPTILSTDLALAYTRLGKLREQAGEPGRASEAYSRALAAYQQAGKTNSSIEELKEIVRRLDDNWKPGKGAKGLGGFP